jgi:hypothetical protein
MARKRPAKASTERRPPSLPREAAAIDALYGLEPVIEPAATAAGEATEFVTVDCPYCGERYSTQVDLSPGSSAYVEDCQVCCQPIELELTIGERGALERVTARRGD